MSRPSTMRRWLPASIVAVSAAIALLVWTLSSPIHGSGQSAPAATQAERDIAVGIDAFSWDLYHQLAGKPGNLVCSPFSTYLALDLAWAGAAGSTADEFARVLHGGEGPAHRAGVAAIAHRYDTVTASNAYMCIADGLFVRPALPLGGTFRALCSNTFGVLAEEVPFPGLLNTRINAWVSPHTLDKIPELIAAQAKPATCVVLVDSIAFVSAWSTAFPFADTRDEAFHVAAQTTVRVPFMHLEHTLLIASLKGATMVELPYVGGDLVCDIIIPTAVDGLAEVERTLDPAVFANAVASLHPDFSALALPRFSIRWHTTVLTDSLQALGLVHAFRDDADFSHMSRIPTRIDMVMQQAFIAVDERGTIAAAATAVEMEPAPTPDMMLRADHPFLFVVRDVGTGALLFMGRVSRAGIDG